MAQSSGLRGTELKTLSNLLSRATGGRTGTPEDQGKELALSLLSKNDDTKEFVGRMIADALQD